MQDQGDQHAEAKADEQSGDELDHSLGPPWFFRQHDFSLSRRGGGHDSKFEDKLAEFLLRFLILNDSGNSVCMSVPKNTNRLAREKSPYLLQHAHNPVDWFAWNEEAFARARAENKPIFLSIGYSTCHWCHVMERESFEQENIGAFLNEHF